MNMLSILTESRKRSGVQFNFRKQLHGLLKTDLHY